MIRTDSQEMNERVEMTVNLYESIVSMREHNMRTDTSTQPLQRSGSKRMKNRSVLVCLVVVCVLLLIVIVIGLCVLIYTNNHQFNINNKNNTQERDQLLTNNTKLTEERNQLLTNNTKLTKERDQLLTNNTNLIKQNEELNQEINDLWKCFNEQDGWKYYQLNCYYISSELNNWTESRRYCRERGADLIIINNKEEQDIIKQISGTNTVWIGLSDSEVEGRWKWVDGSTMNYRSWGFGEPNGQAKENCVASYSSWWSDFPCNYYLPWMCKKKQ